jgi:CheY-like chemotaxis protein
MAEMSGFEVLPKLRENLATRHIPVIINTSKVLETLERQDLNAKVAAILSKNTGSREILMKNIKYTLQKAMQELNNQGGKVNG